MIVLIIAERSIFLNNAKNYLDDTRQQTCQFICAHRNQIQKIQRQKEGNTVERNINKSKPKLKQPIPEEIQFDQEIEKEYERLRRKNMDFHGDDIEDIDPTKPKGPKTWKDDDFV